MHDPEFIKVGEEKVLTVNTISHSYAFSADHSKIATLLAYLNEYKPPKSIIFSKTPATRQTMLLSATVQERILKLAKKHMHDPEFIKVGEEKVLTVNTISHSYAFSADRPTLCT